MLSQTCWLEDSSPRVVRADASIDRSDDDAVADDSGGGNTDTAAASATHKDDAAGAGGGGGHPYGVKPWGIYLTDGGGQEVKGFDR